MAKGDEGPWMEGRTRHVRVYLTEDEHALVRAAAAKVDKSVSRFSVEAIVEAARCQEGGAGSSALPVEAKGRKRKTS
jgi:hypothetical protein